MTENPLARARQALQLAGKSGTQPAALDQSTGNELLARARAAAEQRPETRVPNPPPIAVQTPRVERVRVQMSCGATGRPFIAIAKRRGGDLLLVAHELPQPGRGSGAPAERLHGSYRVDNAKGWACPHCGTCDDTWSCGCAEMPDSLHCGGRRGRLRFCACGKLEERDLVEVETIEVRGQSIAATSRSGPPASPRGGQNLPALLPKR